jgi:hypothetical protein
MRSRPHHPAKVLDERLGSSNRCALLTQRVTVGLFLGVEFLNWALQDPPCLAWREATPMWWQSASGILTTTPSAGSAWTGSPSTHVLAYRGGRSRKPLRLDLGKERRAIVLPFLPALAQVGGIRITAMRLATVLSARLVLPSPQIASDRSAGDAGLSRHFSQRIACVDQRRHPRIASLPTRFDGSMRPLQAGSWRPQGSRDPPLGRPHRRQLAAARPRWRRHAWHRHAWHRPPG